MAISMNLMTAKGISFSIGDITNPDDKVTLKWKGVIKG